MLAGRRLHTGASAVIPIRLYAYAAIALAIGFLVWREHHAVQRAKTLAAENSQLTVIIAAERKNRAIEQDDRRKADESAKSLETELARIRSAPLPVSVWCRPTHLPAAAGQSGAAYGAPGAPNGSGVEEPLRDIGAAVADVWREQQTNTARQLALIDWELARTH